jgi:FixJ family two-component response regulator
VNQPPPSVAIVDDEEPVRRALQRLALSAGMSAVTFASGAEFLESLKVHRPDCVILDLHMLGINGIEVQARLARARDKLPVIVITGHDTDETRERVMNAGAAAYLRKPVDDQMLLAALADAIKAS